MNPIPALAASLILGGIAAAQTTKTTLLFFNRYDSVSLDDKSGLLSALRSFDLSAVTPGTGATAFPFVGAAGISAQIGDPDNDGTIAQFASLPDNSWGLSAPFVKWSDKKSGDPRDIYWSIRELITNPPVVTVFTSPTATAPVRLGDWVRIKDNGLAEFFIKKEHIVKAAGTQSGAWVPGATAIAQDAKGNIFYAPGHGITNAGNRVAGGHWVSDYSRQAFAFDGAICVIPAADITYDASGNVQDVKAGSARILVNEIGSGPNGENSVRDMCANSGALDTLDKPTNITFYMTGLDVDPNGGTFKGWFDKTDDWPNLIFHFGNAADSCCGGLGSWRGTVFSTNGGIGAIAKINGIEMGNRQNGGTDGAWTGIKPGTGSRASAPIFYGLAWMETSFASTAPYGNATLQTRDDGALSLSGNPNADFAVQGPRAAFPTTSILSLGPGKGQAPVSFDLGFLFDGFASVYVLNQITLPIATRSTDAKAQATLSLAFPNNPSLIGHTFMFQNVALSVPRNMLTSPVLIEVRS